MNLLCVFLPILALSAIDCMTVYFEVEKFCGEKLIDVMQRYCKRYYEYSPDIRRSRWEVVEECCIHGCTVWYLFDNYCKDYNKSELLKYAQENARKRNSVQVFEEEIDMITATTSPKRQRRKAVHLFDRIKIRT